MKTRLAVLILLLCLVGYINLSMFLGPFTTWEKRAITSLEKNYAWLQQQRHLADVAKRAEQGDAESQFLHAFLFLSREHDQYDQDKAIYWFEKSGDNGYLDGYHKIAYGLENGAFGFSKDYDKDKVLVEKFYRKAADKGFAKSQNNLAFFLLGKYGDKANLQEVQKLLIASAEGESFHGMKNLADAYMYGSKGFEKDYEKALYWYERAYNKTNQTSKTLTNMAWLYSRKSSPDYNSKKAGFFYWEAARKENLYAIEKVARAFDNGLYGYPKDNDKAIEWYEKAAKMGSEDARMFLVMDYRMKLDQETDPKKKAEYKERLDKWFNWGRKNSD